MRNRMGWLLAGLLLLGACTIPLTKETKKSASVEITVPLTAPGQTTIEGRLLVAETGKVVLSVLTGSVVEDLVSASPKGPDSAVTLKVSTSAGKHTITVDTYDSTGQWLTHGESELVIHIGTNTVSLEMQPAYALEPGKTLALAAGQLAYVNLKNAYSTAVTLNAPGAQFWSVKADGGLVDAGSNLGTVTLVGQIPYSIRLLQGTTAGTVTIKPSDWTVLRDPKITEMGAPTMAVSPLGQLYLSYVNNGLGVVETFSGTAWSTVGTGPSGITGGLGLAIDSAGTPYIAYVDVTGLVLRKWDGSTWLAQGTALALTANYIDLVINPNNNYPSVLATDGAGDPVIHEFDGSSWKAIGSTVGSNDFSVGHQKFFGATRYVAIQETPTTMGGPSPLKLYQFGASWTTVGTTVTTGNTLFGFDIDSNGVPYIAFEGLDPGYKANVVKLVSGSWEAVGPAGFSTGTSDYMTMTIVGDTPYVAYIDAVSFVVKRFESGTWLTCGTSFVGNVDVNGDPQDTLQDTALAHSPSGTLYSLVSPGSHNYDPLVRAY